jgi:GH15 family glucan-1,4-alpha-glucosidase
LACTFWLAQNYALMGHREEAREVFERMLGLRNDVGLLAEEYDPAAKRLVGNFPQAFSHVPLIDTARSLTPAEGPTQPRSTEGPVPQAAGQADDGRCPRE